MEAGGEVAPWLVAAFFLPCAFLLLALGQEGLRAAAAALGYRVAPPGGGGSVFREDDEPTLPAECCDRLTVAVYRRGLGKPDPECVFCLSSVGDGDEVRELQCGHVFHRACLDAWLVRPRATCPLCRDRLLPADASNEVAGYGFDNGRLSSSVYAHRGSLWT